MGSYGDYALSHAIRCMGLSARDLTEYLMQIFAGHDCYFISTAQRDVARYVKDEVRVPCAGTQQQELHTGIRHRHEQRALR